MTETTGGAERAKLQAKLKALLAMTVENGCTEAEAMNAATLADALMRQHDLAYENAAAVEADRYGARTRSFSVNPDAKKPRVHEAAWVCQSIAAYTNCRYWRRDSRGEIVFFGSEHDTAVAHDLADLVRVAMETQFALYLASDERDQMYHGRALRRPFMAGMAIRLRERFDEMHRAREAATKAAYQSSGRALMVVTKNQITTERFAAYSRKTGLRLGKVSSGSYRAHAGASAAGHAAGSRVGLGGSSIGGSGVRSISGR